MPIHLVENQYRGINAHLQSYLRHESGGWQSFHFEHIAHLRSAIQKLLPPGYFVRGEKSLQIRELTPDTPRRSTSIPDAMIYRRATAPVSPSGTQLVVDMPSEVVAVADTLSDHDFLNAVVISQQANGDLIPVTRLELLSPANMPGGTHHDQYLTKRDETLLAGINLVELNYLHESRPLLKSLPSYPDGEPDAFPYTVLVSSPHPTLEQGLTAIYGFFVDNPLPRAAIPLGATTSIALDLTAVYHQTFAENPFYGLVAVDYAQEPTHFAAYQPADQARIRQRMHTIITR